MPILWVNLVPVGELQSRKGGHVRHVLGFWYGLHETYSFFAGTKQIANALANHGHGPVQSGCGSFQLTKNQQGRVICSRLRLFVPIHSISFYRSFHLLFQAFFVWFGFLFPYCCFVRN